MTYTKTLARIRPTQKQRGMGDVIDDLFAPFLADGGASDASTADPADNVNQNASGTSTTSGDFTTVGGVCKAQNFPALAMVEEFQSQMNRVARVKGFTAIAVDGAVGPATLALFRLVQAASSGSVQGDPSSCMGVAPDVDVLGAQIKTLADSLGAPAQVDPPLSLKAPTIVTKSGKILVPPNAGIAGSLATMSSMEKLALVGLVGGIGYMLMNSRRKRRK